MARAGLAGGCIRSARRIALFTRVSRSRYGERCSRDRTRHTHSSMCTRVMRRPEDGTRHRAAVCLPGWVERSSLSLNGLLLPDAWEAMLLALDRSKLPSWITPSSSGARPRSIAELRRIRGIDPPSSSCCPCWYAMVALGDRASSPSRSSSQGPPPSSACSDCPSLGIGVALADTLLAARRLRIASQPP